MFSSFEASVDTKFSSMEAALDEMRQLQGSTDEKFPIVEDHLLRLELRVSSVLPALQRSLADKADTARIQALESLIGQQSADVLGALEAKVDVAEMNQLKNDWDSRYNIEIVENMKRIT